MFCILFCIFFHFFFFFFFFQAEDGIRDLYVTGVQTCALPISLLAQLLNFKSWASKAVTRPFRTLHRCPRNTAAHMFNRSEERRVGKSVDLGGRRIIKKKKRKKSTDREEEEKKNR